MKILLCGLFLIVLTQYGSAIELGFYPSDETKRPGCQQLLDLEQRADRLIQCGKDLRFDSGIGPLVDTGLEGDFSKARSRILFEFAEVESFLQNEKHKGLLVFRFDKSIMWNEQEKIKDYVTRVVELTNSLGYKRVVILGSHAFGLHYLADVNHPDAPTPDTETP
jgi:hypothetical protein